MCFKNILKQMRNTSIMYASSMVWANHTWPEFHVELFCENLR